jgi:hypothetical protein
MVMLTEVKEGRAATPRRSGRIPAWMLADEPDNPGTRTTAASLGIRLSDTLSDDSQKFLDRQWQPSGE